LIVSGDSLVTGIVTVGVGSTIVLDSTFSEGARIIAPIIQNGDSRLKYNRGTIAAAVGIPFEIDSVPFLDIISADYFVNVGYGISNHTFRILVNHNSSSASISTYSSLFTNNSLSSFSANISSGNLKLNIIPEVTGALTYQYSKNYFYQ
jgi:hypothetical protein